MLTSFIKRLALVATVSLLWITPAEAQWSNIVTRTACSNGAAICDINDSFVDNSIDVTGLSVSIGQFIGVAVAHPHATVTITGVVCDSNTLAPAHTQDGGSGEGYSEIWFVRATSACDNVVVTSSGNTGGTVDIVGVIIADGTVNPAAETGTSQGAFTGAAGSSTAITVTPSVSEVLFIAVGATMGGAASPTGDADFTDVVVADTGGNIYFEYRVQTGSSAAATYSVGAAGSEDFTTSLAAFEASTGGAAATPSRLMLFGIGGCY